MHHQQAVLDRLAALSIRYALHLHAPVHTVSDCLGIDGIDWAETELVKNVFLCNRQQSAFYLVLLRHDVAFRTAVVSKALNSARLSFAPDVLLPGMLGLEAGAVSPMGLLFDVEHRVTLAIDEGLRGHASLAFHPCVNTATIVLSLDDFITFLTKIHRVPQWIRVTEAEAL